MIKKPIPTFEVPALTFDLILQKQAMFVKQVESVKFYKYGHPLKHLIYYDGREYMTINRAVLSYFCPEIPMAPHYMQAILRRCENVKHVESNISGYHSYLYLTKVLNKFYTKQEIHEILSSYTDAKDDRFQQQHFLKDVPSEYVSRFKNTYKYDINGAHTYALTQMFPKAKKKLVELYKQRKENPKIKKVLNYYVGCLVPKGYVGAYNHIVQNTTKKLMEVYKLVGGVPIYINTDGFVVADPKKIIEGSAELGQVKLEFTGDTYVYVSKNYWIMQQDKELTGSVLTEVRDRIDLSKGKIVEYSNKLVEIEGVKMRKAVDLIEKKIKVKEVKLWLESEKN